VTAGGIDFIVDHPFLAIIRDDNTGALLFAGQVMDRKPRDDVHALRMIAVM
jgi:serine protease inhibitor